MSYESNYHWYSSLNPLHYSPIAKGIASFGLAGVVVASIALVCVGNNADKNTEYKPSGQAANPAATVAPQLSSLEQRIEPIDALPPSVDSVAGSSSSGSLEPHKPALPDYFLMAKDPKSAEDLLNRAYFITDEELRNAKPEDIKRWLTIALEANYAEKVINYMNGIKRNELRIRQAEKLVETTVKALFSRGFEFDKYSAYVEARALWDYGGSIPPDVYQKMIDGRREGFDRIANRLANGDDDLHEAYGYTLAGAMRSFHLDKLGWALSRENNTENK